MNTWLIRTFPLPAGVNVAQMNGIVTAESVEAAQAAVIQELRKQGINVDPSRASEVGLSPLPITDVDHGKAFLFYG